MSGSLKFHQYYWPRLRDGGGHLRVASERAFSSFCMLAGVSGLAVTAVNLQYIYDYFAIVFIGFLIPVAALIAPRFVNQRPSFHLRAGIFGYICLGGMLYISQQSVLLVSAADVLLVACVMTFTLVLGNRHGAAALALAGGNMVLKIFASIGTDMADVTISQFISLLMTMVFAFSGTSIFRHLMLQTLAAKGAETDRANEANEAKTAFLANMSHEFRTPLNGILGLSQTFERESLCPQQRDHIDMIEDAARAMAGMVSGVLDVSQIEAGVLELKSGPVCIEHVLSDAKGAVLGTVLEKDLKIETLQDPNLPEIMVGDMDRVRQIMINFAGNAVKFSDQGIIRLTAIAQDDGWVEFACSDEGVGIDYDQQDLVFERFRQVGGDGMAKAEGTGLGLAISKELADLMGGRIGVDSAPNEGSRFWVRLPCTPHENTSNISANRAGEQGSSDTGHHQGEGADVSLAVALSQDLARRSGAFSDIELADKADHGGKEGSFAILLVEDNPLNQMIVKRLLKPFPSVEITVADNGALALDRMAEARFDLVLMDVNMPVMDGNEATCKIRQSDEEWAATPIVMLTADSTDEQCAQGLSSGADAVLYKPIDRKAFEAMLDRYGLKRAA